MMMNQEPDNPLMRKKKTPEELAAEAEAAPAEAEAAAQPAAEEAAPAAEEGEGPSADLPLS